MAEHSLLRGRETILRTDEPAGAGLVLWMCAALFVFVFYITAGADFAMRSGGFSYLGGEGEIVGFLFVAACVYAAIALGSWAVTRSFTVPRGLRAAAERTGGMLAEVALLICVLAATAMVVATRSLLYAPLVIALGAPAVSTFFRTAAARPVWRVYRPRALREARMPRRRTTFRNLIPISRSPKATNSYTSIGGSTRV